jgi:hypothetical protein
LLCNQCQRYCKLKHRSALEKTAGQYGGVLAGFPKNYFGHTTNLHLTTPCLEL